MVSPFLAFKVLVTVTGGSVGIKGLAAKKAIRDMPTAKCCAIVKQPVRFLHRRVFSQSGGNFLYLVVKSAITAQLEKIRLVGTEVANFVAT